MLKSLLGKCSLWSLNLLLESWAKALMEIALDIEPISEEKALAICGIVNRLNDARFALASLKTIRDIQ